MGARIPHAERPRFPGEGSSALGEPGPKARPKGVADGELAKIPAPAAGVTERRRRLAPVLNGLGLPRGQEAWSEMPTRDPRRGGSERATE